MLADYAALSGGTIAPNGSTKSASKIASGRHIGCTRQLPSSFLSVFHLFAELAPKVLCLARTARWDSLRCPGLHHSPVRKIR